MLDDLRRHDPSPTEEERAWIDCNPLAVGALAASAIALIAIFALSAQVFPDAPEAAPRIAATTQAR